MNPDWSDRVRILAVDDDQNVLDLYEEFLSPPISTFQFDLTLCPRSEVAVEAVQMAIDDEKHFAVAFLDIRMDSGPDGVWAAEQIRKLDPNIEIVMVTAHGDVGPEEIVSRVPPAGKLLYIRKPFSQEEIKQFAVSLSAKWQQEIQLLKIHAHLEGHIEEKATDLTKANKQMAREIEERRQAEKAMRESEERYRSLFKNNHMVMLIIDPETADIVDANPAACSFYGWGHEELTSKKITDINTLTEEQVFQEIERAKSEQNQHFFFRHRLARNEIVDVEVFSGPIVLNGKQLLYSIVNNVTERKQSIEALQASEEKYRTLLETNPDPVVVYDIDGKVVYFNPAFTRVFGWSLGERLGKKMDVFVPEESWPETKKMISRVLGGESFSGIETRRYTKEGKIIPVSISGAVLRDTDGSLVGSIIDLRDISEQKNLEGQLQQAQKMEAVGTLAGGIAHDFNNLLQAIQGYTELLLIRKKEGESDWRELQEIIRASKRGAELTQQLLTFSRKVESKIIPLNLNQEVGEVRELLERTIPKMIDVEFKLADNLQMVNADPVQLRQVLMNLAVNAKDAMPEGGKLLIETQSVTLDQEFCRRYAEVTPGDYVLFSISDTGHGMAKETLEHIFDPFYTTKEVGKGTGLGLAIVYGIIKNHEGYITCYSHPEVGTTFRIYLPTIEPESVPVDVLIAPEPEGLARGGSETILLVDDEEFIRELGADVLGRAGYTVLTAGDGENALKLYRQERARIDLVILDLIMPGMGGRKCLEELLTIDPHTRVLISSGYSPDGPTKGALDTGAKGFVSKPYDTSQLLQLVREILDRN
jgi:PAS domain S-box-containing protein